MVSVLAHTKYCAFTSFNSKEKYSSVIQKTNVGFRSELLQLHQRRLLPTFWLWQAQRFSPGPGGAGREPLGFFGTTVPLLTVVLKGKVCTSGLKEDKQKRY